jgi:hypothetical protein
MTNEADRMAREKRFSAAVKCEDARGRLATDEDKNWFAANPHRSYRLRPPLIGEKFVWEGDVTRASAVLVKQIQPGLRMRVSINLDRPLCEVDTDERSAKRLWKQLCHDE